MKNLVNSELEKIGISQSWQQVQEPAAESLAQQDREEVLHRQPRLGWPGQITGQSCGSGSEFNCFRIQILKCRNAVILSPMFYIADPDRVPVLDPEF
jgi:hypothetical protein